MISILTLLCWPSWGQRIKTVVIKKGRPKQVTEQYSILRSDKATRHGPCISYFYLTEKQRRAVRKGRDSLARYVRQRGAYLMGEKHGEWAEFSSPGVLHIKGHYEQGRKAGIWLTTKEGGEVLERYDHSTGQKLTPEIHVKVRYPTVAREFAIQGTVVISYEVGANCLLTKMGIIQSVSAACDQEATRVLQTFYSHMKRYGPSSGCEPRSDTFKVSFKLE